MRLSFRLAAVAALFFLPLGCARYDDFTMLSSKNVLLGVDKGQSHGIHEGRNSRWIFLIFPMGLPSMAEATEDALEEGKGNVLVDAKFYDQIWYIPLLIGQQTYVVSGEVYQINEPPKRYESPADTTIEIRKR